MISDWTINITKEVDLVDNTKNPINDIPLFPNGFVVGKRFTMTFLHNPSGLIFQREDNLSPYNKEILQKYATNLINAIEAIQAGQTLTLIGTLDIAQPVIQKTQKEIDLEAFNIANNNFLNKSNLISQLASISPSDATELQAVVDDLKEIRDLAAQPVIDAIKLE